MARRAHQCRQPASAPKASAARIAKHGIKKARPIALHPVVQGMDQEIDQRRPDQQARSRKRSSSRRRARASAQYRQDKNEGRGQAQLRAEEFDQKARR